jgi:hypothetical protein
MNASDACSSVRFARHFALEIFRSESQDDVRRKMLFQGLSEVNLMIEFRNAIYKATGMVFQPGRRESANVRRIMIAIMIARQCKKSKREHQNVLTKPLQYFFVVWQKKSASIGFTVVILVSDRRDLSY